MSSSQYNQVADRLRRAILGGEYAPGTRLPPERALCAQYATSRITIRQALALLAEEQLIIRRQGSGTYVRQNPLRRIPLMIDYTGSMQEHAPELVRELLKSRRILVSEWIADELRLPQHCHVLYAERIDRIDETAVAWDEVYIVERFADKLGAEDLARVDFIEAWSEVQGFMPVTCRQRVEAVAASAEDQIRLGLPVGSPLLKTVEIYEAGGGRPVGVSISHYHPLHITISSRYEWSRGGGIKAEG